MIIKVTEASYLQDYKIKLRFSNGKTKTIDLKDHLWGEVFEPLKDIEYFKNFKLNHFTIEWENGADFAPEFLYHLDENKLNKRPIEKHLE